MVRYLHTYHHFLTQLKLPHCGISFDTQYSFLLSNDCRFNYLLTFVLALLFEVLSNRHTNWFDNQKLYVDLSIKIRSGKMDIEQRKYVRFSVRNNTFAALRSGFEKVGKVNDISKKGLAFSYLSESIKAGSNRDFAEVDIFLSWDSFHLYKAPCKIVYDIQDPKSIKYNSIMTHRCGLHFGELIKTQSDLLELFLKNYTTGPLSP